MIRSLDGVTEFFESVVGIWQGDTSAPLMLIICEDYVLQS